MTEREINNVSSQENDPQTEHSSQLSPGAQLSTHRESLGWSIEQVANQLNLTPRQVQALEQDHYSALPGMVIARGFVRSYAKLLKVDPAPLVAMMADEKNKPAETLELRRALAATFTDSNLSASRQNSVLSVRNILVLGIVALTAGAWFAYQNGWVPSSVFPVADSSKAQTSDQQDRSEQADAKAKDSMPDRGDSASTSATVASEANKDAATQEQASLSTPAPASATPANAAAATSDTPAGESNSGVNPAVNPADNLMLKVREDSWIEIRHADKTLLASKIARVGATESFEINQSAILVIGNAAGVDVTFRGVPVDLKPISKGNVARLELQ